jgi:hypothetical protein
MFTKQIKNIIILIVVNSIWDHCITKKDINKMPFVILICGVQYEVDKKIVVLNCFHMFWVKFHLFFFKTLFIYFFYHVKGMNFYLYLTVDKFFSLYWIVSICKEKRSTLDHLFKDFKYLKMGNSTVDVLRGVQIQTDLNKNCKLIQKNKKLQKIK